MPLTLSTTIERLAARERGSAAFEVLLLMPFILLIWMLLTNMSYSGIRHIKSKAAMNLAAFQFAAGLSTLDREGSRKAAENTVNQLFPTGENPASLTVNDQGGNPNGFPDDQGLLGGASSRQTVRLSVMRDPPYADLFDRVPLRDELIVAANTWTYCEMKDDNFSDSPQAQAMNGLNLVGDYVLWLFGGCPGDTYSFSCEDRCGKP
jgi:hypothetical protein